MSNPFKPGSSNANRIAWATGMACAACCAVPLVGLAVGSASVAGLAFYSEIAAIVVAIVGVVVLLVRRLIRKTGPSCDLDGNCRPDTVGVGIPERK